MLSRRKAVGGLEGCRRTNQARRRQEKLAGGLRDIPDKARGPLFAASLIGGLLTGWVAIGEGEVVAAVLMLAYGVEASAAIGLGVVLLAVNSIFLTLAHQFFLGGVPWEIAAFTGLGAVFGARIAPWIAQRCDDRLLKTLFAAIAIGDGTLFIIQSVLASGH